MGVNADGVDLRALVGDVLWIRAFHNVVPSHQHVLANYDKYKFSGSVPDQRNQKHWGPLVLISSLPRIPCPARLRR